MNLAEKPPEPLQLPRQMQEKLKNFQRKVWLIKICEGLLAAVFGLLVSWLAIFAIDRFLDTPALLRAVILVTGSLGLGLWFPLVCHRWVWKSRQLEQVARLLRRSMPRFGDHLLGIIELVNSDGDRGRSLDLCRAALAQVDEETRNRDFSDAVPGPRHRQWAIIAGIPALTVVAILIMFPDATTNALARWLLPWKDIDRYTFTRIEGMPDQMVVPVAERTSLDASLAGNSRWNPSQGFVYVNGRKLSASNRNGSFEFDLPPLKSASQVDVRIGDVRQTVELDPRSRPELESLVAHVELPAYLQRDAPLLRDIRGGVVNVVRGSSLDFRGQATRDLTEAFLDGQPISVDGRSLRTPPLKPGKTAPFVFDWRDGFGLTPGSPLTLSVRVNEDEQPSLTCRRLERKRILMEKDVLSFEIDASDDFGVRTVGMEWKGAGSDEHEAPVHGEKVVAAGSPESGEMTVVATFSPLREGVHPQAIELRMFVEDYLPGRERIYSPTYTVFILSEEDHAIWVTRQMDRWYRQSLETYERELDLFKQNQAIRNLPPGELDLPQTRRRIESQAAAEKAQSRRLAALTKQGEELVTEAARNDQFNVETLEQLAEMLESLKDISARRMPSVANLLEKASNAPGSIATPSPDNLSVSDHQAQAPEPGTPPGEGDKQPPVPTVSLSESSMDSPDENSDSGEDSGNQSSPNKLTLPQITLPDHSPKQAGDGSCPAKQAMDNVVDEQEELLAEFARVAEELQKIIRNLEGSTFVKRLKAMARKQQKLANDVNATSVASFGVGSGDLKQATRSRASLLSERELGYTDVMKYIYEDLEAYVNRVPDGKFKTVLQEMSDEDVTRQLKEISKKIVRNEPGSTISHAELLSDTLDRWAEQLVGPG